MITFNIRAPQVAGVANQQSVAGIQPMSTNETLPEPGRFDAIELASGDIVIYDVRDNGAWIQSDAAVRPDEVA